MFSFEVSCFGFVLFCYVLTDSTSQASRSADQEQDFIIVLVLS